MVVLPIAAELRRRLGMNGSRGELSGLPGVRCLPEPGPAVVLLAGTTAEAVWAPRQDGAFSRDEMERVARFVFPRFEETWAGVCVLLREVLGRATLMSAAHVRIRTDESGKPSTDGAEFSLSYTGSIVLIGSGDLPPGVDVEKVPEERAVQQVGSSFYLREIAELLGPPANEHPGALAHVQVRKEALLRATGTGLPRGISRDYVGAGTIPGTPVPGLRTYDMALPGLPGYRAALCAMTAAAVPQRRVLSGLANGRSARNRSIVR